MLRAKILIIEDEKDIVKLLQYNLEREGYQVTSVPTGEEALRLLEKQSPDLVILDVMLPGIDGLETCRLLKQDPPKKDIPVLMLTAKSEETDVIVGLRLGADDYVTKPFSPKVLMARVKALLRRSQNKQPSAELRKTADLTIDIFKHRVTYQNSPIELTTLEFNILEFLSRYPGRVFTRDQIMD